MPSPASGLSEHLFEVRTHRRTFTLEQNGIRSGEVAVDETEILPASGGSPTGFSRIEVEVPEEVRPAVEPFVDALQAACDLSPARLSKYEAGVLASGLQPPPAVDLGATDVEPDATIGAVALAVLRRHFGALLASEPGTRLGDDSEDLNEMRVASRRLRAAMALFKDALPAALTGARDELAWLGRSLGAARDLDVQLEQLDHWQAELPEPDRAALGRLRSELERQRSAARSAMLESLESHHYNAFVSEFGRLLHDATPPETGPATRPARPLAADLIELRFGAFRKAARRIGAGSPPSDYRGLWIRGKRLQQALEFPADPYQREAAPLVSALAALQDILGLHQDAYVASTRLRELAADRGAALRPRPSLRWEKSPSATGRAWQSSGSSSHPPTARSRGNAGGRSGNCSSGSVKRRAPAPPWQRLQTEPPRSSRDGFVTGRVGRRGWEFCAAVAWLLLSRRALRGVVVAVAAHGCPHCHR